MHPIHFEFASRAPSSLDLWYDRVFRILEKFDRNVRDDAFSRHYLAYGMTFEEEGDTDEEVMDSRFRLFWEAFKKGNQDCQFDEVAVYGLLCGALGRLHRKSGVESLRQVIEGHKSYIASSREVLASEELPAQVPLSWMREASEKILNLYDEVDLFARGYVDFCERVIRPLLVEEVPVKWTPFFGPRGRVS